MSQLLSLNILPYINQMFSECQQVSDKVGLPSHSSEVITISLKAVVINSIARLKLRATVS